MSGKKRKQGLSGNPQRNTDALRQLAYRMAGGAQPAPWWPESHERVLDRARARDWPSRVADVENLTCEIVGGELFDTMEKYDGGHDESQWLVALTERTAAALRASLERGDDDWRRLWPLLCGIARTAPRVPDDTQSDSRLLARELFPDIRFPHETALAEITAIHTLFSERSLPPPIPSPDSAPRAAGPPLVARDEYGSRFLLVAPFGYEGESADHWYGWDVDACWIDSVLGTGTFGSAEEALREWQEAVGVPAKGAELVACGPEMTARLLRESLDTNAFAEALRGDEPRELFVEYYRERRRARELSAWLGSPAEGTFAIDMDKAREEFLAWYSARHGADAVSPDMPDAVDAITDQWGPHKDIDEAGFYACSPHRIELTARLLREGVRREYAEPAIKLLPEWTQWCVERSGIGASAAARSRGAALTAAAAGVTADAQGVDPDDGPFRRPE